ncbi:MAG: copper resistance protein CopC [Ardenticatenaceae bacterium]|nr:copper resistance protein CopC [Ardenticatenaceae bacterium]
MSQSIKAILLAGLLLVTAVSLVSAHAVELLRSDPANGSILAQSPAEIHAWFGEEMQTGVSTLQVFSASGQRVDNGDGGVDLNDPDHASMFVTLPPLPDGEYLVRWYVVLLDGDASESSFNFFVGDEATAAAANFTPASAEVFYYQAEDDTAQNNLIVWLVGGGLMGVGLLAAAALRMRSRS